MNEQGAIRREVEGVASGAAGADRGMGGDAEEQGLRGGDRLRTGEAGGGGVAGVGACGVGIFGLVGFAGAIFFGVVACGADRGDGGAAITGYVARAGAEAGAFGVYVGGGGGTRCEGVCGDGAVAVGTGGGGVASEDRKGEAENYGASGGGVGGEGEGGSAGCGEWDAECGREGGSDKGDFWTMTTERTRQTGQTGRTGYGVSPLGLLLPYQAAWVKDGARFKIGVQARQTGKSFSTACEAVVDCMTRPGEMWVCLSAGERQALEWLTKCREWAEAFRLVIANYAEERELGEALMKSAEIRFANGSRIIAIPANPSTARGYSANVILDEFAYHEDPDKIWGAMFPSVSNPLAGTFLDRVRAQVAGESTDIRRALKVRVVSTFNGKENKFYNLWDRREANGYSGHFVTIHDAIAAGLPLDVEELRAGLDDGDLWAQEYECQPTDTSNVLLPYDLIGLAESAEATESADGLYWEGRGNAVFCGVDFGRSNDPTVCWTLERIGDLLWTREVLVLKNVPTPEQNEILRTRFRRASRVAIDYTGPGVGFGDYAAKEFGRFDPAGHEFGKCDLVTFTARSKREMFPLLRKAFEAPTRLRVPISRMIREDLHAMQQVVTNGEYNYWAPRTREGHSDRCTALALAVRAAGTGAAGAIVDVSGIRMGGNGRGQRMAFEPRRWA